MLYDSFQIGTTTVNQYMSATQDFHSVLTDKEAGQLHFGRYLCIEAFLAIT